MTVVSNNQLVVALSTQFLLDANESAKKRHGSKHAV